MDTSLASDALRARAAKLGYPFVDLAALEISATALALVPESVARSEQLLPLSGEGDALRIALGQPPSAEKLERLRLLLRRAVSVVLAEEELLAAAIDRVYRRVAPRGEPSEAIAGGLTEEPIDFVEVAESPPAEEDTEVLDPEDPQVSRLVQTIISEGLRLGASRVLILPVQERLKVAYRIQDAVYTRKDAPAETLSPLLARLMTMANLSGFIKVVTAGRERRLHVVFKRTRHGLAALLEIAEDDSMADACRAKAAKLGLAFVDLDSRTIPRSVLSLVPEPVAREHHVLPIGLDGGALVLAIGSSLTPETLDRLRFILNRPIALAMAPEGTVLAAIDRYYGPADPETADLMLWELAQSAEPPVAGAQALRLEGPVPAAAQPLLDYLRTLYRDKMLEFFESLRDAAAICRQDSVSGDLEVVFPHAPLTAQMSGSARRYLESKIWMLREAIVSRLEHFLERNPVARRVAMTYSQYLACCQLAENRRVPINPAATPDAWVNFLAALVIRSFPAIDSNGALLHFVNEHLDQISEKLASLVDDPDLAVNPGTIRQQLAELESQTTLDEGIDYDSPPIIHLLELLIAEAVHLRARRVAIVPLADRVEVAYRIQCEAYLRQSLSLRRLYPLLGRLRMVVDLAGEVAITIGQKERHLRVAFHATTHGLAATIDILPDVAAVDACKAQGANAGCEFVNLEETVVPAALFKPIPKTLAWKKSILPLALHEGTLTVVLSAPPAPRRLEELRLIFKRAIAVALAPQDDILAAIYRHYHPATAEPPVTPIARALLGL